MSELIKNAILRILSKRQAEQAFLVKTYLLHVLGQARRYLARLYRSEEPASPPLVRLSDAGGQTSFGYFDITPFSENNQLLLATILPKHNAPPKPGEAISVGYFDIAGKRRFHNIGSTTTWCWQQGCRLQWYPENESELVIYNKLVDDRYGCVVQNINSGEILREYRNPVYTLDRSGRWAVFPNFSRLNRLRPGYGYVDLPDRTEGFDAPGDDGIYLFDLATEKAELLVTLEKLATIEPLASMENAEHYVNHFCFNPSGEKFLFFHLWDSPSNMYARLMTCDRETGSLVVLEDRGEVSHYAWKNNDEVLATFTYPGRKAKYQLYDSIPREYVAIREDILTRDGHPSYSPDGTMVVTDTYADKNGEQHLLLIDEQESVIQLGRYSTPIMIRLRHNGEARCDLHPRWDRQSRQICFDSAHSGERAMYVYDLNDRPDRIPN